jgi:hypothetical protein
MGEEQPGQGADVLTRAAAGISGGGGSAGVAKAAEHGPALLVEQDVRRLDGAMVDPEVVEVCDRGRHSGAESGDHLPRLEAELAQIAPRHPAKDQRMRRVATLLAHELHHARMGERPQEGSFAPEPAALLRRTRPFVDETSWVIMKHIHN